MSTLLVQSCSKSKNHGEETSPALERYSGYFYKIIKKAMREGAFDRSIDLCILSAEHGLIDADADIGWYDRRMDRERAAELAPDVQADLRRRAGEGYDEVIVNAGEQYRRALRGVAATVDADVYYIEGGGIGEKGNVLKRLVRGETGPRTDSAITQAR